jgi:hypothetical protein
MAIFLGDKPVTVFFNGANASLPVQGVFLGPVQVFPAGAAATVPGAPVLQDALESGDIIFIAPSDGGSAILGYAIYVNGVREADIFVEVSSGLLHLPAGAEVDDDIEIAAINAVGEGPKSNAVKVA